MANRTKIFILSSLVLAALAASCSKDAVYNILNVSIKNEIDDISRGHIHASFTPNRDAWYMTGLLEKSDEYNPEKYPDHFMVLMLDSLYREYLDWRYEYLKDEVPYIADFASHSLNYGNTEKNFEGLKPDTDYWLYSFVVDPESNSHVGELFLNTVHTLDKSSFGNIFFSAQIVDQAINAYVLDKKGGSIKDKVPFLFEMIDSVALRDSYPEGPVEDAIQNYQEEMYDLYKQYDLINWVVSYGKISIDWSEYLENNETLYLALGVVDAGLSNKTCYKFKWDSSAREIRMDEVYREKD